MIRTDKDDRPTKVYTLVLTQLLREYIHELLKQRAWPDLDVHRQQGIHTWLSGVDKCEHGHEVA